LDRNPDAGTVADPKPFQRLETSDRQTLAEARWDLVPTPRDRVTFGFAWRNADRDLDGLLQVLDPNGSGAFRLTPTHLRNSGTQRTLYGEWEHRASERFDLKVGGYLDQPSGVDSLALPKVVARYRPVGKSYLVYLAYPTTRSDATELSPVEAWAQPLGFDRLGTTDAGWTMSHELHYERPTSRLGLLSLSAFLRSAHGLLLDLEHPRFAPAPTRLFVPRARIRGGEAAFEHALGRSFSGRLFARYQSTVDRESNRELPYFPRWQGGIRLDYLDRAGWRNFLALTYVGRRAGRGGPLGGGRAPGAASGKLAGFPLLDLRLARQLSLRQSLFLQINNLLDREYEVYEGYPESGRSVQAGVEYRF
jgi:outer membrane receptor protein involved in Fe transport